MKSNTIVQKNGIIYSINEKEQTADIISISSINNEIIIPRSICYESREFIILNILQGAFKNPEKIESVLFAPDSELQIINEYLFKSASIKSISIPPHVKRICKGAFSHCSDLKRIEIPINSELQTIEKNALYNAPIRSIFIPESLTDLKEGWCKNLFDLRKIEISPKNPRYLCLDEKFIIGKTTEKDENYNNLILAVRNIKEAKIPSFIKVIGPCAFCSCSELSKIDIQANSELQIISKNAFSYAAIEKITIPPHVKQICKSAFKLFENLKQIEIPLNSELQTIEKKSFYLTSIESIFIPANLIELKKGFCKSLPTETKIEVDPNNSRYKNFYLENQQKNKKIMMFLFFQYETQQK